MIFLLLAQLAVESVLKTLSVHPAYMLQNTSTSSAYRERIIDERLAVANHVRARAWLFAKEKKPEQEAAYGTIKLVDKVTLDCRHQMLSKDAKFNEARLSPVPAGVIPDRKLFVVSSGSSGDSLEDSFVSQLL